MTPPVEPARTYLIGTEHTLDRWTAADPERTYTGDGSQMGWPLRGEIRWLPRWSADWTVRGVGLSS